MKREKVDCPQSCRCQPAVKRVCFTRCQIVTVKFSFCPQVFRLFCASGVSGVGFLVSWGLGSWVTLHEGETKEGTKLLVLGTEF